MFAKEYERLEILQEWMKNTLFCNNIISNVFYGQSTSGRRNKEIIGEVTR